MEKVTSSQSGNRTNVRNKNTRRNVAYITLYMLWYIWPFLTEKIILRLFFSPLEYKINSAEKELLRSGEKFQITVNDKKIQCWKWGEGPLVILAHGWNGRGIQFQPLIDSLIKSNFSVVTFDAPGHGKSEGKSSNYFEFTDALRTLWKYVDQQQVVGIVGHSLGAAAILNFISKEHYNKKTILIAPALKLRELLFQTFEDHNVPKIVYQNLVQNLELVHGYNIFQDNPAKLIKNMKREILIFHDENDRAVPFSDSNHISELLNNVILKKSSGLGHKRIVNDKSVVDSVVKYLKKRNTINIEIQRAS